MAREFMPAGRVELDSCGTVWLGRGGGWGGVGGKTGKTTAGEFTSVGKVELDRCVALWLRRVGGWGKRRGDNGKRDCAVVRVDVAGYGPLWLGQRLGSGGGGDGEGEVRLVKKRVLKDGGRWCVRGWRR